MNFFFFLSKNGSHFFLFVCLFFGAEHSRLRRLIQCQVQKICWFLMYGAHEAQSTHSVCLISVFFVHFVYLLDSFSEVNVGFQPPPPLYQAYIIHQLVFCLLPTCHMTFHWVFLCYCIIFYINILINMYICFLFVC